MTTEKEQEVFSLVIERYQHGASENDIRAAFQDFLQTAGVAALVDMRTEAPPGAGYAGQMDLYVHNTCIEFKTDILRSGAPNPEHIAQLDGYIENLLIMTNPCVKAPKGRSHERFN